MIERAHHRDHAGTLSAALDAERAERALSRALSGSCQLPLGAFAQPEGDKLRLRGFVASQDGTQLVRAELTGAACDPEALGTELAARLKAQGAAQILAALEG